MFVHLFASGFKGSTGSVVQEKSTEDKLTQVRFVAFLMLYCTSKFLLNYNFLQYFVRSNFSTNI